MIFFGPKEISVSKEELKEIYEGNRYDQWITYEEFRGRVFNFTNMWNNSEHAVVPDNCNLYCVVIASDTESKDFLELCIREEIGIYKGGK